MATRFCTQCGQQIPENSKFCVNCGAPVPVEPTPGYSNAQQQPQQQSQTRYMGERPKSYLALAILTTLFCCLPFGIVSIVFAAKVDNYWNAGDYIHAEESSRKAKKWALAAIITGIIAGAAYLIMITTLGIGMNEWGANFFDELY